MKKIFKKTVAFILMFGFLFNSNLLSDIKEVKADEISIDDLYTTMIQTGGSNTVYQLAEGRDPETGINTGDYVYFTIGRTKKAGSTTVHRTIGLNISRIKDGVNPLISPWSSYTIENSANDPHVYIPYTGGTTNDPAGQWCYIDDGNGNKISRDSFVIYRSSLIKDKTDVEYARPDGNTVNAWFIDYDWLWNTMNSTDPSWYSELKAKEQSGEVFYFGCDNIKTIVTGAGTDNEKYHAQLDASNPLGAINPNPEKGYNSNQPIIYGWANWDKATQYNHGISAAWTSWIKDYYRKYFRSQKFESPIEPPENPPVKKEGTFNLVKDGDDITNTGNTSGSNVSTTQSQNLYAAPGIFTYNDSDEFDLGTAIPTSNNYKNGIIMDGWYGNVELTDTTYARTEKTTNYAVEYSYTKHHSASGKKDENGNPIDDSWDEEIYETEYANKNDIVSSTWQGTYTTITDVNLYQLQSANTYNEAGGTISYAENILTHVPYSITVNGTRYNSGSAVDGSDDQQVPSFNPSESYHVKNNEFDKSRITVNIGNVGNSKPSHSSIINSAKGQVQYIWNSRVKNNASLVTLQNDEFTIDGVTYLTNPEKMTQSGSGVWLKGGNQHWTYVKDKTHEMVEAKDNNIKQDQGEAYIPSSVINGYYYTNVSAIYKSFVSAKNQLVSMEIDDNLGDNTSGTVHDELNDSAKPAIIRTGNMAYAYAKPNFDYTVTEPVVVHTPVIAPIHIADGETTTQLVDKTGMSLSQLILDHEYTINFDWASYFKDLNHYNKGYDAPAGWTKYIQEKYVAFPFSVEVNGVYYDLLGDGYTDWVPVGSTMTSFKFYIPSWSQEGLYYDPSGATYSTWNSFDRPIKVRVEAENMGSFADSEQVEYNGEKKNYVATFTYPCQVSGIIYGFQVVSVKDSKNFATADWEDKADMDVFNFVSESKRTSKLQAEKKVGKNNRLGLPYQRYTLDGDMTDSWKVENTLPFASGKSVYGTQSGYLVRGNTIAFTLKTIANLTGPKDNIKIKPNYRYYSPSGALYDTDDIDLYYLQGSTLIKMGSTKDYKKMKPNYLYMHGGSIWYHDCYFDYMYDTFNSTAEHKAELWRDSDIDENFVKRGSMEESYCVAEIDIDQSLCLWTGNEEEMDRNIKSVNNTSSAIRYTDSLNSFNTAATNEIADLAGVEGYNYFNKDIAYVYGKYDDSWSFESSMQTWYGKYSIPSKIYVCPKGALEDYLDNEVDYVDFTEDFWLPDDGKLILNFDITSNMDGHNHLQYYGTSGAASDMWTKEHGDDPDPSHRPGDVGIIELKYESVADHYNVGTVYIN